MSLVKKDLTAGKMGDPALLELPNRETLLILPTGPLLARLLVDCLGPFHVSPMVDTEGGHCVPSIFPPPEDG